MKIKTYPFATGPDSNAITWHLGAGEVAFTEDQEELNYDGVPGISMIMADYSVDGELIAVEIIFSTDEDTE